ncbi:DUF2587 domain-containing protein [bacterium]|nr:DUF2587 domain-containing protein [bacterium]
MTDEHAEPDSVEPIVEAPELEGSYASAPKLMRIASMTRAMLDEIRQQKVDESGRRRLVEIYSRSIEEIQEVLSPDLKEELAEIFLPLSEETASESEVRIVQAQLVGWLEGLFAGIQATLFSQQAAATQQLQQMRMKAIEAPPEAHDAPGQYL